ncbi:MAG: hypothetical protein AB7K63_10570 [Vicinamibacterales bacterium]
MYARLFLSITIVLGAVGAAFAQDPHAGHVMPAADGAAPDARQGSGTSWLPDETPMYAVHRQQGDWMLMGHGNLFLQYLKESGDRGSEQAGSINWLMGMARRPAGAGRLTLRGMVSFEPWTIGGCGYPDLLATGELCDGEAIHDRQHPHDLFMELAAEYDRPLGRGVRLQLYGGPVGEPALGPVAFMHRISGVPNALAPMTHHWFDATHITFGVATAGVYASRWKLEGSVFNGREPDEDRTDFDFAAMDSWSARASFLPTARWALQVSAGHLNEAEPAHDEGEPRVSVDRITASAAYHRRSEGSTWATTVGWGSNAEEDERTHALLVESAMSWRDRDSVYGRAEWAQKSGHDLDVPLHDIFSVGKLQVGYTRYLAPWKGLAPGIGAALSTGVVPQSLQPYYGGRFNAGVAVYVTLRPAAMTM